MAHLASYQQQHSLPEESPKSLRLYTLTMTNDVIQATTLSGGAALELTTSRVSLGGKCFETKGLTSKQQLTGLKFFFFLQKKQIPPPSASDSQTFKAA